MSQKYPLKETLSPINKDGRDRINENWTRIMAYFDYVQSQIKVLAGGQEVDELITRLEQAIEKAEIDVQNYITQVDTTVQQAIDANNTATQDAIAANNAALQTALDTVAARLIEVTQAISNAETATEDATNAKNAAIQATQDAQVAIDTMQSLIDNFGSRGAWSSTTQYYKNNLTEVDGRTYIALKENINTPVTDKSTWSLFADKGIQGAEGPRGLPGKDGKDGTGVNIIGGLTSEDDLPTVGTPGDAYMIGGDLYVWQGDTGSWKNVGPIQGPEGKSAYDLVVENGFEGTMEEWIESLKGETGPRGPEGPQGPPGQDADLTEITEQLDQLEQTTENHITNTDKHLQTGERDKWNTVNNKSSCIAAGKDDADPDTEQSQFFVTAHSKMGGGYWWVENKWFSTERSIQMQVANKYLGAPDFKVRHKIGGVWEPWSPSLQDLKQSVSDIKTNVAQAITDKGVPTSPDATGVQMAANIRAIQSGKRTLDTYLQFPPGGANSDIIVDSNEIDFEPKNISVGRIGASYVNGIWYPMPKIQNMTLITDIRVVQVVAKWKIRVTLHNGYPTPFHGEGITLFASE